MRRRPLLAAVASGPLATAGGATGTTDGVSLSPAVLGLGVGGGRLAARRWLHGDDE